MYVLVHMATQRVYVGMSKNVASRLRAHARPRGGTKLARAVAKYGAGAFIAAPVYYLLGAHDRKHLCEVEAALIAAHSAVTDGFNIKAADDGSDVYSEEYGARISAALQRPEVKALKSANTRRLWASPTYRDRVTTALQSTLESRTEKLRAIQRDPTAHAGLQARAREGCVKAWNDPEKRAARSAQVVAALNTLEAREKKAASCRAAFASPVIRAARGAVTNTLHAARKKFIADTGYDGKYHRLSHAFMEEYRNGIRV